MENHDRLEELSLHSHELQKTAEQLAIDLADDRRQVKRDRKIYLTFIAVLTLMMGSLVIIGFLNHNLNTTITSCVDPSGKCYQDARARHAADIGDPAGPINSVAVAAAACGAEHPGDVASTLKCTKNALKKLEGETP